MNHSQENKLSIPLNNKESSSRILSEPQTSTIIPQFINNKADQIALISNPLSALLKQELSCLILNLEKALEVEKTNKTIEKKIAINKSRLASINTLIEH